MTTTATQALTPKQTQVLDLLKRGTAPAEIAKRLKISPSGVYGHMRNIRQAGYEIPESGNGPDPASAPTQLPPQTTLVDQDLTPPTPVLDPAQALQAAIAEGKRRTEAIDVEVSDLHEQCAALEAEQELVAARTEKFSQALSALA